MPKTLQEARREAAALNDELLTELRNADPDEPDQPTQGSPTGDRQACRGVPLLIAGGIGGAIYGTVPGSDAHLDQFD